MEYYSVMKKKETLLFTTTWLDHEAMLSEKPNRKRQILYASTPMWNLKSKAKQNKWKNNNNNNNKNPCRYRK